MLHAFLGIYACGGYYFKCPTRLACQNRMRDATGDRGHRIESLGAARDMEDAVIIFLGMRDLNRSVGFRHEGPA